MTETNKIFLNDWSDSGLEGLKNDFSISDKELEGVEILVATYTYEYYSGSAFVLFKKDGKLFEVNGGHCSCYGLEGQWEPSEVTEEEIKHRIEKGDLGTEVDWSTDERKDLYATEILKSLGVVL